MEGSPIVAEVKDPDGRTVQLDAQTWNYVLNGHEQMVDYLDEVMEAIRSPDHREDDLRVGRQRYFRRGGPEAWLRVVTELAGEVDRVVTAFPQSNDPRTQGWQ